MAKKRSRSRGGARGHGGGPSKPKLVEWVGGVGRAPVYVRGDDGEAYRPLVVLWLDVKEAIVVAHAVLGPGASPAQALTETLVEAMGGEGGGPTVRPQRLCVSDPALADELRKAPQIAGIEVRVGATPDIDEVLDQMADELMDVADVEGDGDQEPAVSFLDDGRVPPALAAKFFDAAARLWDAGLVRVDPMLSALEVHAPAIGLQHAVAATVTGAGEVRPGILLFSSAKEFVGFSAMGEMDDEEDEDQPDLSRAAGSMIQLAIGYHPRAEVPPSLAEEIERHKFRIASPSAYPELLAFDEDGVLKPIDAPTLELASVLAESLAVFLTENLSRAADMPDAGLSSEVRIERESPVVVEVRAPHPELESLEVTEYDANKAPAPEEWLSQEEDDRAEAVYAHHVDEPLPHPIPDGVDIHVLLHVLIENQIAEGEPPEVKKALDRLMAGGLDRHESLHAIASRAVELMWAVREGKQPDMGAYSRALDALTVESWRAAAEEAGKVDKAHLGRGSRRNKKRR